MRKVEKSVLLQLFDQSWKEHLLALDHLRQGIGLRAYGQSDPLNEYKREAFKLFSDHAGRPARAGDGVLSGSSCSCAWSRRPSPEPLQMQEMPPEPGDGRAGDGSDGAASIRPVPRVAASPGCTAPRPKRCDPNDPATWGKVSRNAACPCGAARSTSTATAGSDAPAGTPRTCMPRTGTPRVGTPRTAMMMPAGGAAAWPWGRSAGPPVP